MTEGIMEKKNLSCILKGLEEFCSGEKGRRHFKEIIHNLVVREG